MAIKIAEGRRSLSYAGLLGCLIAVAACRSTVVEPDLEKARLISGLEALVAVAKIGAKVCRSFPVGVSEQNWVRGRVTGIDGDAVVVTIDDAGRFAMELGGRRLEAGGQLRDIPRAWTPCL